MHCFGNQQDTKCSRCHFTVLVCVGWIVVDLVLHCNVKPIWLSGFLSAFCPRGGGGGGGGGGTKRDCMDYWGGGGGHVHICVQRMRQTRGVWGHAPPGSFDFGPFIRCKLVESGTVLALT